MKSKIRSNAIFRFPVQIMYVLDNAADEVHHPDVGVSWLPNGKGFCIHNKKKFTRIVLPKYFNNIQFSSFTRQMRRWGFKAVQGFQRNSASYSHPLFLKGDLQNCRRMCPVDQSPKHDWVVPRKMKVPTKATKTVENEVKRTTAASHLLALRAGGLEQHQSSRILYPDQFQKNFLNEPRGFFCGDENRLIHVQPPRKRMYLQNFNVHLQASNAAHQRQTYLAMGNGVNQAIISRSLAARATSSMPGNAIPMMQDNYASSNAYKARFTPPPASWFSLSFSG